MRAAPALPWRKVLASLARGRAPGQAVIQFSDACNATCLHCAMRSTRRFTRTKLDVDRVKRLLDKLACRQVMAVSFTGGEPMLHAREVALCADHARSLGIASIRTGTNGFFLRGADRAGFRAKVSRYAELLAQSGLTNFWISLDSADPAAHERHRGLSGVVRGMAKGLPIFHEHGLYPAANLCINRHMGGLLPKPADADPTALRQHFFRAFTLYFSHVLELGFTSVNICHPMTPKDYGPGQAVYQAASDADFIRFRQEEREPLYRALFDAVTHFRKRLQVFTPRSTLLAMIRQAAGQAPAGYGCLGGQDYFFVDSAGMDVYPCGYRGDEKLTHLLDAPAGKRPDAATCTRCDWECFRDPSHLFGPLLELFRNPLALAKRFGKDPAWAALWLGDVLYLRSCGWFDARRPPKQRVDLAQRAQTTMRPSHLPL